MDLFSGYFRYFHSIGGYRTTYSFNPDTTVYMMCFLL